jgi:2,3-bisphosphoglycerate-independent phosphoglycerate mutase
MPRVALVFVDGVGLGDPDPGCNPCLSAELPVLAELLDGTPLIRDEAPHHAARASLVGIDATLGFEGTPQSGTGQAALLTGIDAVAMHGRHFGPWVPAGLRTLVREQNVLCRARAAGCRVAFANAYPEEVLQIANDSPRLPSDQRRSRRRDRRGADYLRAGPPLAALGADVLDRHTAELERGDAVASEITNEGWREVLGRGRVPVIDAATAGANLARIVNQHDLTMFAHYATDYAGHRRNHAAAEFALRRFDTFLGGLVATVDDDVMVFVVSDHGNLEDTRVGHTRNPALGLVMGDGHALIARRLAALTDVTPTILDVLALR